MGYFTRNEVISRHEGDALDRYLDARDRREQVRVCERCGCILGSDEGDVCRECVDMNG